MRFAVKQTANPVLPWKVICFEMQAGVEVRSEFITRDTDEREKYKTKRGAQQQVARLNERYRTHEESE